MKYKLIGFLIKSFENEDELNKSKNFLFASFNN